MTPKTKKTVKGDSKFDYKTIKSFDDACAKLGLDTTDKPLVLLIPEEFKQSLTAVYKLMIIYKAINNGWVPDWGKSSQYKYYPWFWVLPSGSGFSDSAYYCAYASTDVGSRLCTDTSEKAQYMAEQFKAEYQDYLLLT